MQLPIQIVHPHLSSQLPCLFIHNYKYVLFNACIARKTETWNDLSACWELYTCIKDEWFECRYCLLNNSHLLALPNFHPPSSGITSVDWLYTSFLSQPESLHAVLEQKNGNLLQSSIDFGLCICTSGCWLCARCSSSCYHNIWWLGCGCWQQWLSPHDIQGQLPSLWKGLCRSETYREVL